MGKNKNGHQAIWVYAVVLFTSAFIVLLLTAYSQIKFNKNIDEYKNQISTESNEKKNFLANLNGALDENKSLLEELNKVKDELKKANEQLDENNKNIEQEKNALNEKLKIYEQLMIAKEEYWKGNITESAKTLYHHVNSNLLEGQAKDQYLDLVKKTYKTAAYQLYLNGYKEYSNKRYDQAIENFTDAQGMVPDEFYSDDSLYFIAYSYYRQNDITSAAKYFNEVINQYPQSNYSKDAQAMLKILN